MLTNLPLLPLGQQAVAVLTGFATDFSRMNGTLSDSVEREERVISLCRDHLLRPLTSLPLGSVAAARLLAEQAPERAEEWARELAEFPWLLLRCGRSLAGIAASVCDPTNDLFNGSFGDASKVWLRGAIELGNQLDRQTLLTLQLDQPRAFAPAMPLKGKEDGVVSVADRLVSRSVLEAVDQRDFSRAFELMDALTQQVERGEVEPYTATSLYEIAHMVFTENVSQSEFETDSLKVLRVELGARALLALASLRDERALEIAGALRSSVVDPVIRRLVVDVLWRGGGFGNQGLLLFRDLLACSQYDLTVQTPTYEADFDRDNAGKSVLRVTAARERSEPGVDLALLRLAAFYGRASVVFDLLKNNSRLVASHSETVAALRPFGLTYEVADASDLRRFRTKKAGMDSDFVRFHFLEQSLRYGPPKIRQEAALEVIRGGQSAEVIAYLDRRPDLQEMVILEWLGKNKLSVKPLLDPFLSGHALWRDQIPPFVWRRIPEPLQGEFCSRLEKLLRKGRSGVAKVLGILNTPDAVETLVKAHRDVEEGHLKVRMTNDFLTEIEESLSQLALDGNQSVRNYLDELVKNIRVRIEALDWESRNDWKERESLRKRLRALKKILKRSV